MQSQETVFSRNSLNLIRNEFKKHFPIKTLKGITAIKQSSITVNKHYYVSIPKNTHLPKGYQWTGQANDANDAKGKAIIQLFEEKNYELKI